MYCFTSDIQIFSYITCARLSMNRAVNVNILYFLFQYLGEKGLASGQVALAVAAPAMGPFVCPVCFSSFTEFSGTRLERDDFLSETGLS